MPRWSLIRAIVWRDVGAYFSNPTGYVFITVFVALGAGFAFWPEAFFASNLATLDTLTASFPGLLLFFIPAITMGAWADEKRQGTEELLLTLPATEFELVAGKYLATVSIYAIALLFSITHLFVLWVLGSPDVGLIASTYFGYFLLGAGLIAVAMIGSQLAGSATVGFIYGALLCGLALMFEKFGQLFAGSAAPTSGVAVASAVADGGSGADLVAIAHTAESLTIVVLRILAVLLILGASGGLVAQNVRGARRGALNWILVAVLAISVIAAALLFAPAEAAARVIREGSLLYPFRESANGVVTLQTIVSLVAIVAAMLFLAQLILRVRRRGEIVVHGPLRFIAAVVIAFALTVAASRVPWRLDMTAERLNTLTDTTHRILVEVRKAGEPVYVTAFVSSRVPREYLETRKKLLQTLREFDARAGDAIVLEVEATEPYSAEALKANEQFGISGQRIGTEVGGVSRVETIYLGVAMRSGAQRVVIPFMHKRYSPEYELTRGLRVVSRAKRPRLGLLSTDAKLRGGFNFQTMGQTPSWAIITELEQQYEVVEVAPDSAYPNDLDVMLAVAASSLPQDQMDRFKAYVTSGKPIVIVEDPWPSVNPALSPNEAKSSGRSPFQQGPPPTPKGDFGAVMRAIGVRLKTQEIVWDEFNPHPSMGTDIPRHFVFVSEGNGAKHAFHPEDPISAGLQEVVALWAGHIERASESVELTPLLTTGATAGTHAYRDLISRTWQGPRGPRPMPTTTPTGRAYVLAARVKGTIPKGAGRPADVNVNVCVLADLDMISNLFFRFRQSGPDEFDFDNISLILNAIDSLAGEDAFIALRKRRARHRRLVRIEAQVKAFTDKSDAAIREATNKGDTELAERQKQLNDAVDEIQKRTDIDAQQKTIMAEQRRLAEQRKFDVSKVRIEADKERTIYVAKSRLEEQRRGVHHRVRLLALLLPPIPAVLLGLLVWGGRRRRELEMTR